MKTFNKFEYIRMSCRKHDSEYVPCRKRQRVQCSSEIFVLGEMIDEHGNVWELSMIIDKTAMHDGSEQQIELSARIHIPYKDSSLQTGSEEFLLGTFDREKKEVRLKVEMEKKLADHRRVFPKAEYILRIDKESRTFIGKRISVSRRIEIFPPIELEVHGIYRALESGSKTFFDR